MGLVPLHPRTILRVHGPDSLRFLNGQLTNKVELSHDGSCIPSALLNAKGLLEVFCWLRQLPDNEYLLDAPIELRESLPARLDRYLIADEVELSDESDHWVLEHHLGEPADGSSGGQRFPADRFGESGVDVLWSVSDERPSEWEINPDELERLRISRGIPAWGRELVPGMLPPEAGLDRSAISYDKGCYLGQEVISRMKRAGKTNRHLALFEVPAGTSPGPFFDGEREAGELTSIAPVRNGEARIQALGFRKRVVETQQIFSPKPEQLGTIHFTRRLA